MNGRADSIWKAQPLNTHSSQTWGCYLQRGGPKSTVSRAFSCSFCRWLRSVIFRTVPVMVALFIANLQERARRNRWSHPNFETGRAFQGKKRSRLGQGNSQGRLGKDTTLHAPPRSRRWQKEEKKARKGSQLLPGGLPGSIDRTELKRSKGLTQQKGADLSLKQ